METVVTLISVPVLIGIALYLLYIYGFMTINAKSAAVYIGKRRGRGASFSSCSGYTKRVLRFREDSEYRVSFDCTLAAGDVSAEILDRQKRPLISLNSQVRRGDIAVEKKKRYYLVVHFKSATGDYTLSFDKQAHLRPLDEA